MPSASSKSAPMTSQVPNLEGQDPLRVVVSMMEKKVRNLEKRKTKLVSYTQQVQEGKEIDKEQKDAVKKLEFVDNSLELAKEFQQIFKTMEQEHLKLKKKEQKRAKVEMKEKTSEERHNLVLQVLEVQTLLENLSVEVKEDFLNAANGAVKLTEEELEALDGIYKLITPNQNDDTEDVKEQVTLAADHLQCLIDEKDKPVLNTTYKEIHAIIFKVRNCRYFEKSEPEDESKAEEPVSTGDDVTASENTGSGCGETAVEEAATVKEEEKETIVENDEDAGEAEETSNVEQSEASQEQSTLEHPMHTLVNGVDLPVEFRETPGDTVLNFMGESEVQPPVLPSEEGKLNAASPEFIPRSLQSGIPVEDASTSGWNDTQTPSLIDNPPSDNFAWQDVPTPGENHQSHHGNRPRNGPRGRDRGGFRGGREGRGGRGRGGGYGQNGSNYYRQDRQDNFQRRDGNRGGSRGGNQRGSRGGPRGSSRGNAPRGGAFNRQQQQQQ